jgi:hypothetical protein
VVTASREWWEYAPSEAKPHPYAEGVRLRDDVWYWAIPTDMAQTIKILRDELTVITLERDALKRETVELRLIPTAWMRGIRCAAPGEPDEWDVDFVYGEDEPDNTKGWIPLYRRRDPASTSLSPSPSPVQTLEQGKTDK